LCQLLGYTCGSSIVTLLENKMLKEEAIIETAQVLERLAYEIADLSRCKEELEKHMAALLEHPDEGQKSYIEGRYKIVLKTGFNWTLNKEKYEMIGRSLSTANDPVQKQVKYELNKKIIRDAYASGNERDIHILDEILTKKPAKLSVTIGAGI